MRSFSPPARRSHPSSEGRLRPSACRKRGMTMRFLRLAPIFAAALLVGTANAADGTPSAPTGLHGFLLRADEAAKTTLHRTPSFAWNPVPGATGYQFQVSTSSTFRDNGTLYNTNSLTTPVASPPIVFPWITGSPHALYA